MHEKINFLSYSTLRRDAHKHVHMYVLRHNNKMTAYPVSVIGTCVSGVGKKFLLKRNNFLFLAT